MIVYIDMVKVSVLINLSIRSDRLPGSQHERDCAKDQHSTRLSLG